MLDLRRHTIQLENYTISIARTYTNYNSEDKLKLYSTSIATLDKNNDLVILDTLSKLYNDGRCIDIRGTAMYQARLEHRVVELLKKVDKRYSKCHYDLQDGSWHLIPNK